MAEETLERHTSYGRGGAGNLRKAHRPVFPVSVDFDK